MKIYPKNMFVQKFRNKLKRIDDRIKKSKNKTTSLFNNIIAGIATSVSVGAITINILKIGEANWVRSWAVNGLLLVVFLFIFYFIGRRVLRHITNDDSEYKAYKANYIAGICASIYCPIILTAGYLGKVITIILSVPALVIILNWWAKRRKY